MYSGISTKGVTAGATRNRVNSIRPDDEYASVGWVITGSGNGMAPNRHQSITWTNADVLTIEPLGTKVCEILIKIQLHSYNNMNCKMSLAKCRWPFLLAPVLLEVPRGLAGSRRPSWKISSDLRHVFYHHWRPIKTFVNFYLALRWLIAPMVLCKHVYG